LEKNPNLLGPLNPEVAKGEKLEEGVKRTYDLEKSQEQSPRMQ